MPQVNLLTFQFFFFRNWFNERLRTASKYIVFVFFFPQIDCSLQDMVKINSFQGKSNFFTIRMVNSFSSYKHNNAELKVTNCQHLNMTTK